MGESLQCIAPKATARIAVRCNADRPPTELRFPDLSPQVALYILLYAPVFGQDVSFPPLAPFYLPPGEKEQPVWPPPVPTPQSDHRHRPIPAASGHSRREDSRSPPAIRLSLPLIVLPCHNNTHASCPQPSASRLNTNGCIHPGLNKLKLVPKPELGNENMDLDKEIIVFLPSP